jgi:hypothetical protein
MRIASTINILIDANKLKLVEYLSLPKSCRPMPLKLFAKQVLGISEPTIHAWKKMPEVILATKKTIENKFVDDIPDVLRALRDNALAGNSRAAKLFLDYINIGDEVVNLPRRKFSKDEVEKEIEKLINKFYPNC